MKRRALEAAALALVVSTLWCLTTGRTSLDAWRVPVDYSADALFMLGTLRAAQDGRVLPLVPIEVPELGAPNTARWNRFLRQHKPQYWLAGRMARVVGLFPAANLLVLLAAVLAALAFHAVARHVGARAEWAFAGACAFALSPFFFYRSLTHITLAHYWPIPLAILVVSWAFARKGLPPRSGRFAAAAVIVVVAGFHNIYFAAVLAQFLGLAMVAQLAVRRSRPAALGALALLLLLAAAVAVDNANMLLRPLYEGHATPWMRPYGNLERYALKPIELVLPISEGAIVPWRAAGAAYLRLALVRGEFGSAYLGLAGTLALVGLALVTAAAVLRRPQPPVPKAAFGLAWILLFSVVGGLNGLVGLTGFVWLRATSRHSIWILALVLLWGAREVSRARFLRRRTASLIAATAVAILTLADQLPPRTRPEAIRELGRVVASDAGFTRALEATLPERAMLFLLPVVDYPEGPRLVGSDGYDPLRLYLHATRLRFSYGSDRHPREAWQRRVESLEPAAMAVALERIGFAGIVANRTAYADAGHELQAVLAASGRLETIESANREFLLVRLKPVVEPAPPDEVVPPLQAATGARP